MPKTHMFGTTPARLLKFTARPRRQHHDDPFIQQMRRLKKVAPHYARVLGRLATNMIAKSHDTSWHLPERA
jgi:hypothetical protein